MKQIKEMPVDYKTAVKYRGMHKGIYFEISAHSFKTEEMRSEYLKQMCSWNTYVILNEEQHEKFKPFLDDAPWNCGQTFYKKITEEHISIPPALAEEWNKPFYKMGDDFNHLYDDERMYQYNREYMETHIKHVIDYLVIQVNS